MPIPEAQLTTWSAVGAQTTSTTTYATIANALREGTYSKDYKVFLQGSYGNDTNVYKESDVDVVMQMTGVYYYDASRLGPLDAAVFNAVPNAGYTLAEFRNEVLGVLRDRFGNAVTMGTKAIRIDALHNRRKTDVLVCATHNIMNAYPMVGPNSAITGISFFKPDYKKVINYPEMHSTKLTLKHQATNGWFKPTVRIFKNARNRLVDNGQLQAGVAPSYYIEGLLYNCPLNLFGTSYAATLENILRWLVDTDKSHFTCAHGQYYLFGTDPDIQWNLPHYSQFFAALVDLWADW